MVQEWNNKWGNLEVCHVVASERSLAGVPSTGSATGVQCRGTQVARLAGGAGWQEWAHQALRGWLGAGGGRQVLGCWPSPSCCPEPESQWQHAWGERLRAVLRHHYGKSAWIASWYDSYLRVTVAPLIIINIVFTELWLCASQLNKSALLLHVSAYPTLLMELIPNFCNCWAVGSFWFFFSEHIVDNRRVLGPR